MARRRHAAPGRPRRFVALVLAIALASGAAAAGTFLLVRQQRLDGSADRAVAEARESLDFARQNLPPDPGPAEVRRVRDALIGRGFETVVRAPDAAASTLLSVGPDDVPAQLQDLVASGLLAYQRADVGGTPYLVVGGRTDGTELYLFFSEEGLHRGLAGLALLLLAGWAGIVLVAVVGVLAALQSRVRALSEARARERRFTADVAHELRTPLAALVAEASLLGEHLEGLPEEDRRTAELIVQDVGRLRRMVEDLLEISRLDAGGERVEAEPVEVTALVRSVLRARGWEPRVAVEGGPVTVRTDPRRLERITANLIGNALAHGGRDVRVRVARDGPGATVEVSDRGPGIPPDALPHVFERFYKADPSRAGGGSGLGLAIALENARLLGGDLRVWSEPGEGTRFTLRLPDRG